MSLIKNLYKKWDNFILDIPLMNLSDQGMTVLWGPSGSGKTSLLRILVGLEECDGFNWNFQGIDLAKLAAPERKLGVVFQQYELFPHLSARENILFAAQARKISQTETDIKIRQFIEQLDMSLFIDRKAKVLSGGEMQRVALARSVIGDPRFLLLDEPFSALDSELRVSARQLVKKFISDNKVPTLLITHDEFDLNELADHVIKIKNGKIQ